MSFCFVSRWRWKALRTSFFVCVAASFLLIANWLIALPGLVYSPLIVERVGHEERTILDTYGEEYRQTVQHTVRFLSRLLLWEMG